jgi:hypothetical protein
LHWENEDVREALAVMAKDFRVTGKHFHQLAGEPPAQIVLEMTMFFLTQLGPNLAASAIWDGIKLLWTRRKDNAARKNILAINVRNGDRECIARIETDSEDVAKQALSTVSDAVQRVFDSPAGDRPREIVTYDDGGEWKKLL